MPKKKYKTVSGGFDFYNEGEKGIALVVLDGLLHDFAAASKLYYLNPTEDTAWQLNFIYSALMSNSFVRYLNIDHKESCERVFDEVKKNLHNDDFMTLYNPSSDIVAFLYDELMKRRNVYCTTILKMARLKATNTNRNYILKALPRYAHRVPENFSKQILPAIRVLLKEELRKETELEKKEK